VPDVTLMLRSRKLSGNELNSIKKLITGISNYPAMSFVYFNAARALKCCNFILSLFSFRMARNLKFLYDFLKCADIQCLVNSFKRRLLFLFRTFLVPFPTRTNILADIFLVFLIRSKQIERRAPEITHFLPPPKNLNFTERDYPHISLDINTFCSQLILTYLLTHSLTHSLIPWCRILFENLIPTQLVEKNILLSLCNPKVNYRVHKSPPLEPILSQANPVRPIDPCLLKVHLNAILRNYA
jgi:hypothetical protein